jgi:hypothetical protein
MKTNLTWSLDTTNISIHCTYFSKHGSHNSLTYIGLLRLKSVVFGTLDLVTIVKNTSFTNLLEHFPPRLEIAGLLQCSTPSCEDSHVNPTWLKCLYCQYILLVDAARCWWFFTVQLGTPRGRYDEYSSKFSLSKKPRFNRIQEKAKRQKVMLASLVTLQQGRR